MPAAHASKTFTTNPLLVQIPPSFITTGTIKVVAIGQNKDKNMKFWNSTLLML